MVISAVMEMIYLDPMPYIGICKVCQHGMLEIHFNFEKEVCSIACDECMAEWDTPENALKNVNGYRGWS